MPLPPRPAKRFEGRFAPPQSRASSRERIRQMAEEHEKKERPFDPEKRGTWRGGQHELVLNPADFERDLREFVNISKLREPDEAFEKAQELLESKKSGSAVMDALDKLFETHGVEAYPPQSMRPRYLYLNTGDTYNATLIYDTEENKYFVSTFGDIVEEEEPKIYDEAWSDYLAHEVRAIVDRTIEYSDITDHMRDKIEAALERGELGTTKNFRRMFDEELALVGGQMTVESDGSVFVDSLEEAAEALGERILRDFTGVPEQGSFAFNARRGKRHANASKTSPAMSQSQFVQAVKDWSDVRGRSLRFKSGGLGRFDSLYINFYNIPDTGSRAGAELENNRMLFRIDGWDRASADTQVFGNVKIEQMVSALPREYRLRAKTGKPAAIAAYLAAFLTKVASEVEPKYTHSRAPNRR